MTYSTLIRTPNTKLRYIQQKESVKLFCMLRSAFKISCYYYRKLLLYYSIFFFASCVCLILLASFATLSFCLAFVSFFLFFSFSPLTSSSRRTSILHEWCFPLSSSFLQSRCCALFFVLSGERKMQEEPERDLF